MLTPTFEVWTRRLASVCSLAVGAIGLLTLGSWALGCWDAGTFGAGYVPMAPSTATMFVLCAVAILVRVHAPRRRAAFWVGLTVNAAVALVALVLLVLSVRGVYLGAEHLGFAIHSRPGETPIGHMSPMAAFCFLLAALSFLAALSSAPDRPLRAAAAWWLACLLAAIGIVLLLAYLYGMPVLYGSDFIPPAATTSLAFLVLGFALLGFAAPPLWASGRRTGPAEGPGRVLVLVFAILATGIVSTGLLYYRRTATHYRAEVERQLATVAELKVADLVQWRKERLADAAVFHENADFAGLVRRFFDNPDDADAAGRVRTWLAKVQAAHGYDRVSLLDAQGVQRVCVPDTPERDAPQIDRCVPEVLRLRQVTFVDLHRNAPDRPIHLLVMAPVLGEADGRPPLGVFVLRIDPHTYLYPLLGRWPTPSRTAETLLVRREGNEAVFLNELRFKTNAALNLRSPLNHTEMPAVKAVLGEEGIVEGRDYRGVPVLACVRAVPDSPWFLVARMDLSEVDAPLRQRLWVLVGVVSSLLLAAGAVVGLLWRRQTALYYKERYEADEALCQQEARYHRTLDSMMDGCHLVDRDWRYVYVNDAGARHGQRKKEELAGRTMLECYAGIAGTDLIDAMRRCMDERVPRRMENRFTYPDGSSAWFKLSIQPVLEGMFILSTDITERKYAEEKLRHLTEVLRAVRNVNQLITHEKDRDTLLRRACDILTETRGYRSAWIGVFDAAGRIEVAAESGLGAGFAVVRAQLESGEWPECCRQALARPGIVVTHDTSVNCVKCPLAHAYRDTAALAGALRHAGRDYGVLVVALPAAVADDENEQSLFGELSGDISFALFAIEGEHERQRAAAERQQMQAQLLQSQKLESIGTLASGVAHEINNPINGILNYAQLIHDVASGSNEKLAGYAAEILRETERVAIIVKNLLTFARHEKQGQSPACVKDIVENTLSLVRTVMRHDQIILEVDVPGDMPKIRCRSQQIQQVLMNLLTNARDALNEKYPGYHADKIVRVTARVIGNAEVGTRNAERGGREVISDQLSVISGRVSAGGGRETVESAGGEPGGVASGPPEGGTTNLGPRQACSSAFTRSGASSVAGVSDPSSGSGGPERKHWIRLTVEDHGGGIPPAVRDRILDPFFTTKPKDKGTGLGLSISHGIVKDHGGELWFESEVGKCTRFHVDLPVMENAEGGAATEAGSNQ